MILKNLDLPRVLLKEEQVSDLKY